MNGSVNKVFGGRGYIQVLPKKTSRASELVAKAR
jgi:hypothetical protein